MSKTNEPVNSKMSNPEMFITFYYSEVKDLSKSFLTLVSGILAFSVTFSSTILDYPNTSASQVVYLIISWFFLIIAIIAAGSGIYTNFVSANIAQKAIMEKRENEIEFKSLTKVPYLVISFAGVAFVIGLIFLALAGFAKFI